MATKPVTKPVQDSVARVNNEVAVGEDLDFQRKWWRFENAAWAFFTLIIVLDLAGLFGRGPIAKAERRTADGTIDVKYERIERTDSPSIMTIRFGPSAIQDGKIQLYVSNSLSNRWGPSGLSLRRKTPLSGKADSLIPFPLRSRRPA